MPAEHPRSPALANTLLVAGSLLMTALLLVLLEVALRFSGVGAVDEARASRLKYQQIYLPILESAERTDGTPILRTTDSRLPYQSILAGKPHNGLRIVTFGGSATAGLGFSPNVTFARHLERMLVSAYPDRQVEVLNLGIVALAARQVKVLAEDTCRNHAPDAILVYSGNNEFLEMHAEKYAAAHAGMISRVSGLLVQTNLYRLLDRILRGPPGTPSLADQNMSTDDLRMTEDAIIRDIEVTPEEIETMTDRYEDTLESIVTTCQAKQVPVVLMTVATNWEWRGREDLPAGWLDEIVPAGDLSRTDRYRKAREVLTERIASAPESERYEWLYKRALVLEALGDPRAARDDYRASMNADPHLRRATDAMADRVRRVAGNRDVPLVDVVEELSAQADHGIVGFDEFYDYVHFTPRGVVLVATGAFREMLDAGILPRPAAFDPGEYARERLAWLARLDEDPLDSSDWMGFGFNTAGIADRDLWKYDKLLQALDQRIETNPDDLRALVYRGNAHTYRVDGAARAAQDYARALEISDDNPVIRANLERLLSERRP